LIFHIDHTKITLWGVLIGLSAQNMENIEHRIVFFSSLRQEIFEKIEEFCKQFEICFKEEKIKSKDDIFLFFSLKTFLNVFEKSFIKNPIIVYDETCNEVLIRKNLKKISKILNIPILYYEKVILSKGFFKELSIKSDIYNEKYEFSVKTLNKFLEKNNKFLDLKKDILKFKIPFIL